VSTLIGETSFFSLQKYPLLRSVDNLDRFPPQLRHRPDAIVGAAFSPSPSCSQDAAGHLLLRSHGFLCLVDLSLPPPRNARIHPASHLASKNDLARRSRRKPLAQPVEVAAAPVLKRLRSNSIGSTTSITSDASELGVGRRRTDSVSSVASFEAKVDSEPASVEDNRNFAITLK